MNVDNPGITAKKLQRFNAMRQAIGSVMDPVRSLFTIQKSDLRSVHFCYSTMQALSIFRPLTIVLVSESTRIVVLKRRVVYSGEVEHRDSSEAAARSAPVMQWMTAASGIVHEEFHGQDYARKAAFRDGAVVGQIYREV